MDFFAYNPRTKELISTDSLKNLVGAVRRSCVGPWIIAGGAICYSPSEIIRFAQLEPGAEWLHRSLAELQG